ncbi:MAG: hypothetical protein BGO65_15135 [Afipia sp. 64-13]|nr:MAG: hypothetical protein BGO65_15135 [Afipia sp. 64-13]
MTQVLCAYPVQKIAINLNHDLITVGMDRLMKRLGGGDNSACSWTRADIFRAACNLRGADNWHHDQ